MSEQTNETPEWKQREDKDDAAIVASLQGDETLVYDIDVKRPGKSQKIKVWDLTAPGYFEAAKQLEEKIGKLTVKKHEIIVIEGRPDILAIRVTIYNMMTDQEWVGYAEEIRRPSDILIGQKVNAKATRNGIRPFIPWDMKQEMIKKFRNIDAGTSGDLDLQLMDEATGFVENNKEMFDNFGEMGVFWDAVKARYDVEKAEDMTVEDWKDLLDTFEAENTLDAIAHKFDLKVLEKDETAEADKADENQAEAAQETTKKAEPSDLMEKCMELVESNKEVIGQAFAKANQEYTAFWDAVKASFDVAEAADMSDSDWAILIDLLENIPESDPTLPFESLFASYFEEAGKNAS